MTLQMGMHTRTPPEQKMEAALCTDIQMHTLPTTLSKQLKFGSERSVPCVAEKLIEAELRAELYLLTRTSSLVM